MIILFMSFILTHTICHELFVIVENMVQRNWPVALDVFLSCSLQQVLGPHHIVVPHSICTLRMLDVMLIYVVWQAHALANPWILLPRPSLSCSCGFVACSFRYWDNLPL